MVVTKGLPFAGCRIINVLHVAVVVDDALTRQCGLALSIRPEGEDLVGGGVPGRNFARISFGRGLGCRGGYGFGMATYSAMRMQYEERQEQRMDDAN